MPDHHAPDADAAFSSQGVVARSPVWKPDGDARFGIVVARFNAAITDALFEGAVATLLASGVRADQVTAYQVPGAVEVPAVLSRMGDGHFDGAIALACIIRGETAHFDYVCRSITDGVGMVATGDEMPVGFGVLTVDTVEQAAARAVRPSADPGGHNVGADAAAAMLASVAILRDLPRHR